MPGPTLFEIARSLDNELKGNFRCPDQTFTAGTYPVTEFLYTLLGNATAGDIDFNLPTAVGRKGMRFTFKKIDSTAFVVSFNALGAETIDGASTVSMIEPNESYQIESDGANWVVVAHDIAGTTPGVSNLDIKSVIKTDNDFSTLDPVPGTTIAFTTSRDGVSFFSCSAFTNGISGGPYTGTIGVKVDGVDYTLFSDVQNNGAGGDFTAQMGYAGSIGVPLAAGAHTVSIVVTQAVIGFQATVGSPMTLTVIFPSVAGPQATASPIVAQEVEDTSGTTFVPNNTAFQPFGPVLALPIFGATQLVAFDAFATAVPVTGDLITDIQLGIRIDGVDYPGTTSEIETAATSELKTGMTAAKKIALTPGVAHTAQLVARNVTAARATGGIARTAAKPAYLGAIYTAPATLVQLSVGIGARTEGVQKTDGDFAVPDAVTLVPGTLVTFTPTVSGKTIVDMSATVFAAATDAPDYNLTIGVRIDGTTDIMFPDSDGDSGWGAGGNGLMGRLLTFTVPIDGLTPNVAHTVQMLIAGSDGADTPVFTMNATAAKPATVSVTYPVVAAVPGDVSATRVDVDAQATVDAYAVFANKSSVTGILGVGTIKNTGAQSLTVKESALDAFGVSDSVETVVTAGNSVMLDPTQNFDTALPPHVQYLVEVKSTTPGSPTTFDMRLLMHSAP